MKRSFRLIFALWGFLFLTFSCGGGGKQEAAFLCRLDSLVEADADSALRLMGRMQSQGWPRRDAMRLELLRAKAMNRADSLFTTDSLMLRVAEYYRSHGSQNDRMLSLYLLGCTYRDMGAAPRAIETWQRAVAEADTTRQDCDLSTLMRIHSQMGRLFRMQHLPEYEKEELEQAEALCWRMRDTISAIAFEQASCNSLFNKKDYKGCIQRADTLYHKYMAMGLTEDAALVSVFCVRSYLELKDLNNVKHYLDIYESYALSEKDHRKINGGLSPYYIYKGNYYLGIGNIDSAEYCFRQAMPEMHMLHNDVDVYYRLYQIYAQKNQPDSTQKYVLLYASAKEKKFDALKSQATADAKNLYDYSVEQRIAKEEREKAAWREQVIILISVSFVVALFIAAILWSLFRKNKELRIKGLEMDLSHALNDKQTAEKQIGDLLQENSRITASRQKTEDAIRKLEDDLASKEELFANEKTLNEVLAHEKEEIEMALSNERTKANWLENKEKANQAIRKTLYNTINERDRKIEELEGLLNSNTSEKDAQLRKRPIYTVFADYASQDENGVPVKLGSPTEKEWKSFIACVQELFPTFYIRTHSQRVINDEEYRICVLVKAGFKPKQVEQLIPLPYNTVSTRRKRLLKKIFNIHGSAEEFDKRIRLIT